MKGDEAGENIPSPERWDRETTLAKLLQEGSRRIWGCWSSLLFVDRALGLISGSGVNVHTNTDTEASNCVFLDKPST